MALVYSLFCYSFIQVPFVALYFANLATSILFLQNIKMLRYMKYIRIYCLAFIFESVLLIYNARIKLSFLAGVDWINFHNYAINAIKGSQNLSQLYLNSTDLFVFITAIMYKIFGPNAEMMYFILFPLSLLLFRYVYKVTLLITQDQHSSAIAALAVMLFPVNIIFQVSYLRVISLQLLVAISFYYIVKYIKSKKLINFFYALIFGGFATLTHSGLIVLIPIYIYLFIQNKFYKNILQFCK